MLFFVKLAAQGVCCAVRLCGMFLRVLHLLHELSNARVLVIRGDGSDVSSSNSAKGGADA